MHLYMITRGIKRRVDKFINDLAARHYPYEAVKGKKGLVELSVRPIQLWEVVFPEPEKDKVLSLIGPYNWNPKHNTQLAFLRKMLGKGVKKLPPKESLKHWETLKGMRALLSHNIEVAGIGIKEDAWVDGIEKL